MLEVQCLRQRPECSINFDGQVVWLDGGCGVQLSRIAEMDRGQKKFEIMDRIFDGNRFGFVSIGQLAAVDGNFIHSQKGERTQRTSYRFAGRRFRFGSGRCLRAKG